MDSTLKVIEFVTTKNKYTIFYYKIPVSFGSPHVSASVSMHKFSVRVQDVLIFHDVVWFGF